MRSIGARIQTFFEVVCRDGPSAAGAKVQRHLIWRSKQGQRRLRRWAAAFRGSQCTIDGLTFQISGAGLSLDFKAACYSGAYEVGERKLIREHLPAEFAVVELGGCIGVVSCIANRLLTDPTRHIVVEANPKLIPVLELNRRRNGSHFQILHRAVGYDGKTLSFNIHHDATRSSDHALRSDGQAITIPAVTVASICRDARFDRASVICDIEGTEIRLLQEEADFFREHVECLIIEMHPSIVGTETVVASQNLLKSIGFHQLAGFGDVAVYSKSER